MHIAIYARVSTTRQAENDLSIPDQLRQLHEWAKANGHLVVQEYVEPGASATDDKRAYSTETGRSVHGKLDSRSVATRGLFFTPDLWV